MNDIPKPSRRSRIGATWPFISNAVTVLAGIATIGALIWPGDVKQIAIDTLDGIEGMQENLLGIRGSVDKLADSIPYWVDVEIIASAVYPTALHPNVEENSAITVRIRNPTNYPVRIAEITAWNDLGAFEMQRPGFMVTARGEEGVQFDARLHRLTSLCIAGSVQNGTAFREIRDVEFQAPSSDDPRLHMGFAQFGTTTLDRDLSIDETGEACGA